MLTFVFIFSSTALAIFAQHVERHLVGDSVTLSCTGKVYPGWPIIWYREDRDLSLSSDDMKALDLGIA